MDKGPNKRKVIHQSLVPSVLDGSCTAFMDVIDLPEGARNVCIKIMDGKRWLRYEVDEFMRHLPIKYQVGDIVAGLEEWHRFDPMPTFEDTEPAPKISYRVGDIADGMSFWYKADTMPEDFSRMKMRIAGVRAQQLGDHYIEDNASDISSLMEFHDCNRIWATKLHWNTLNPDHPYDSKQWTFLSEFELI